MTKSPENWIESQLAWQQRAKERELASPRTPRYWRFAKRSRKPSAADSPGSETPRAKSGESSSTEPSSSRTNRGG